MTSLTELFKEKEPDSILELAAPHNPELILTIEVIGDPFRESTILQKVSDSSCGTKTNLRDYRDFYILQTNQTQEEIRDIFIKEIFSKFLVVDTYSREDFISFVICKKDNYCLFLTRGIRNDLVKIREALAQIISKKFDSDLFHCNKEMSSQAGKFLIYHNGVKQEEKMEYNSANLLKYVQTKYNISITDLKYHLDMRYGAHGWKLKFHQDGRYKGIYPKSGIGYAASQFGALAPDLDINDPRAAVEEINFNITGFTEMGASEISRRSESNLSGELEGTDSFKSS